MATDLEDQITAWRQFVARRDAIATRDVAELEGHLRDTIDDLAGRGLAPDEAFLVAVKRMGRLDELSREFAREHSDRLWKQLVVDQPDAGSRTRNGFVLAIALAVAAAVAVKLPALFGITFAGDPDFYARNLMFLTLPFLAAYFLVRHRGPIAAIVTAAASFATAAVLLNVYPFATAGADGTVEVGGIDGSSATETLAIVHAVVALWLVIGIAYVGGAWRSSAARMDFLRFTGEWFVYLVLLGLGGGVLAALTMGLFSAIGMDAGVFVEEWLIPCGLAGAIVIAAWLVEAKQSVIENIAPVLTRVFTPLFTALLLALIVAGVAQGSLVEGDRDLLIIFDIVLVVVLGLVLYSLSARDPDAPAGWFERLQLVLLVAALAVDVLVLVAMVGRIGAYGASPNKLASLGLNLILLVNLAGAAWHQLGFLRGRTRFARLETWQTSYLAVFLGWAAIVVVAFPPLFGFA